MGQRSRVVVGSIVGAVAVHLAMLACSGSGGIIGGARHDAGDVLDAVVAGDLGVAFDAAGDVLRDAMIQARDGEVRDANAGPNDCQCIRPRETSISFTVNRGRGPETPIARWSTAQLFLTAVPGLAGVQGEAAFQVSGYGTAYLSDGTQVSVSCLVFASRAGQYLPDFGRPPYTRSTCGIALTPSGMTGLAPSTTSFNPPTFSVFANDSAEMRISSIAGALSGDAGTLAVNNLVIRVNAPGARLLDEPAPAFRP
jgi:hypothetical protein